MKLGENEPVKVHRGSLPVLKQVHIWKGNGKAILRSSLTGFFSIDYSKPLKIKLFAAFKVKYCGVGTEGKAIQRLPHLSIHPINKSILFYEAFPNGPYSITERL